VLLSSWTEDGDLEPRDRFAVNLRRARLNKGISQEELGFRCDLHRTEVSRLGTIVKLAGALDTTPQRLCAGIAWETPPGRFKIERAN
jgi:transcriptional regulator with XRE-family HTH domain